jgi:isoleucyl-tRNA synthetase
VHLTDYPDDTLFPSDPDLVRRMDLTRTIASTGSSLRKAAKLRVRLPLAGMDVVVPDAVGLEGTFADILRDELNLKSVTLVEADGADEASYGITRTLSVNARAAGPRLGKQVQVAIKASKSGDWSQAEDGTVTAGGLQLQEGEYTLATAVDTAAGAERAAAVLAGGGFVVLDTALTPALEAEGRARDLIRAVQAARKSADMTVGARVRTSVQADAETVAAAEQFAELIKGETLTVELELSVEDVKEPVVLVAAAEVQA